MCSCQKNYPCAKFGSYSSMSDVTMTPAKFCRLRYRRFCMFVNQVLCRDQNVASRFFGLFGMLECCSLHFSRKIAKSLKKLSNYGLQNPLKSLKFRIFSEMLTSSNFFGKFQCFHKKMTKSVFFSPTTLINTKYECHKKEKVEHENSM